MRGNHQHLSSAMTLWQTSFALPRPIGLSHITGHIWLISFAQIEDIRHKARYNRSEKLRGSPEQPMRVWNLLYNIRWESDCASSD
jgi:hypothetical protein